jgi:hypothetical protein
MCMHEHGGHWAYVILPDGNSSLILHDRVKHTHDKYRHGQSVLATIDNIQINTNWVRSRHMSCQDSRVEVP